jgi:hypothetical protein
MREFTLFQFKYTHKNATANYILKIQINNDTKNKKVLKFSLFFVSIV